MSHDHSPAGLSLKQRSPSMEKKFVSPLTQKKGLKLNSNRLHTLQPPSQTHPQQVTSFAAPLANKTPARPKPKDDDIFASMGLAVQPKFQVPRSAPVSGSSWGGSLAADTGGATDAAWDGDDDLDDLFDD